MCVLLKPCTLRDWELHVHFHVHGSADELYGDGFAVWYTKHRLELGQSFNVEAHCCMHSSGLLIAIKYYIIATYVFNCMLHKQQQCDFDSHCTGQPALAGTHR